MTETEMRETLAKIDRLRAQEKVCTQMTERWSSYKEEQLVEVRVRRQWMTGKQVRSERVMSDTERALFLLWLGARKAEIVAEVGALARWLDGGI